MPKWVFVSFFHPKCDIPILSNHFQVCRFSCNRECHVTVPIRFGLHPPPQEMGRGSTPYTTRHWSSPHSARTLRDAFHHCKAVNGDEEDPTAVQLPPAERWHPLPPHPPQCICIWVSSCRGEWTKVAMMMARTHPTKFFS